MVTTKSLLRRSGAGEHPRLADEGTSHVAAGTARESITLLGAQFKTSELLASGIFCLICLDCRGPRVTETTEGEAVDKGEGLCSSAVRPEEPGAALALLGHLCHPAASPSELRALQAPR